MVVSSTSKVSDGWIRNSEFNSCSHKKPISIFVWWQRIQLSEADDIDWNFLKKKKSNGEKLLVKYGKNV